MLPDTAILRSYYRSALTALRYLDERSGRRRFGADADARWHGFAGDDPSPYHDKSVRIRILPVSARIDLLLRDADVQWPNAFGARTVFDRKEVAEDDAFGHDWVPHDDAETLWHQVSLTPLIPDLSQLLESLAAIWEISLKPIALPPLRPNTRWLIIKAPSAVAAAIEAFAADPTMVWHTQVLVVADTPLAPGLSPHERRLNGFTRQLAALAAGLLAQPRPTRLLSRAPTAEEQRGHVQLAAPEEAA